MKMTIFFKAKEKQSVKRVTVCNIDAVLLAACLLDSWILKCACLLIQSVAVYCFFLAEPGLGICLLPSLLLARTEARGQNRDLQEVMGGLLGKRHGKRQRDLEDTLDLYNTQEERDESSV